MNSMNCPIKPFKPQDPANVRSYACGPTAYSHARIGDARSPFVFDVLARRHT